MKPKYLVALLCSLLIVPVFLYYGFSVSDTAKQRSLDVFIGIDVAYENLTEIKTLIDETSSYTNLFVIGCTGITHNATRLNETCQYVYDKGLSFIIYREWAPRTEWLEDAKERWGDRFLGFYAYDEAGGKQLDLQEYRPVMNASDYADAGSQFINGVNLSLNLFTRFLS